MNTNIVFKLSKDKIIISSIKKEVNKENLNNTNIIDIKELKFSTDYIKENFDLVSNFLNVVIIKNNINETVISNMDIALIAMDLINVWPDIKSIYFKPDKKINMDIFMKLLDNKYINKINCYELASHLIERLDVNKKVKVVTRHKYVTPSKFMILNELSSYSDIYYKKSIVLSGEFNETDLEDYQMFIRINDKLKHIKIVNYSNELITTIINELITNRKNNILIEINEKSNDLNQIFNSVTYLKKRDKKYFEENNIRFKINYSKEYKNNNFLKELNIKMFASIILMIIVVSGIVLSINLYQQYKDQNKIEDELLDIEDILNEAEVYTTIDDNESDIEYIDENTVENVEETTTKKKGSSYSSAYYTNFEQVFEKLLSINNNTVGWLSINNTKINYPVVKADNNSYYLNHDFYKRKNSMGWIFMDYRNNANELDQNTIIYGHNIKQGIMFGTIKNMMNSSWYNKVSNLTITFNTPTKNMKWQIFSLYQVNETEDYLKTEFATIEEFREFINLIKSRSKKDFGVEIADDAKILTLSTCFTTGTRHVVHAVLIEE